MTKSRVLTKWFQFEYSRNIIYRDHAASPAAHVKIFDLARGNFLEYVDQEEEKIFRTFSSLLNDQHIIIRFSHLHGIKLETPN